MTQQTWSIGIKLFNEITDSTLLAEHFKNSSTDSVRVLSLVGKVFRRHLIDEFSQKLTPDKGIINAKETPLVESVLELKFTQNNQQQKLDFGNREENISDFFEGVLQDAAKVIDEIYQKNPDFAEHVIVSSKSSQNGIKTKSDLCTELVNKLRRTKINTEPLTFVLPSGNTLDMYLKRIQRHSFEFNEHLILTGKIVYFSDIEKVFKLQENDMRHIHRITIFSLPIETRDLLLDAFKTTNLINVTVRPRNKLISGSSDPHDYEFINFSITQQKFA